jgi:hypothetical protein
MLIAMAKDQHADLARFVDRSHHPNGAEHRKNARRAAIQSY